VIPDGPPAYHSKQYTGRFKVSRGTRSTKDRLERCSPEESVKNERPEKRQRQQPSTDKHGIVVWLIGFTWTWADHG